MTATVIALRRMETIVRAVSAAQVGPCVRVSAVRPTVHRPKATRPAAPIAPQPCARVVIRKAKDGLCAAMVAISPVRKVATSPDRRVDISAARVVINHDRKEAIRRVHVIIKREDTSVARVAINPDPKEVISAVKVATSPGVKAVISPDKVATDSRVDTILTDVSTLPTIIRMPNTA